MEQLKLLSTTALLTLLIWVSADSLVTETEVLSINLTILPAGDAESMYIKMPPEPQAYRVHVSGPRRLIEQLRGQQRSLPARVTIGEHEDGPLTVPLRDKIQEQWEFSSRLAVLQVDPPTIDLVVDHWMSVTAPIVMRPTRLQYRGTPVVDRADVALRILRTRYQELTRLGQPIQAEIDADEVMKNQPKGTPVEIWAPVLTSQLGEHVTASPARVQLTATVSEDRVEAEIRSVPILIGVSVENFGAPLHIARAADGPELRRFTTIRIAGPSEAVEKIQNRKTYVAGWIQLKESDLDALGVVKRVTPTFALPPGVSLVDPGDPIEFVIQQRPE